MINSISAKSFCFQKYANACLLYSKDYLGSKREIKFAGTTAANNIYIKLDGETK